MNENIGEMPDVEKVMNRTVRHSLEDGIGEMLFGVTFILVGLVIFGEATLKPPFPHFWTIAFVLVVWAAILLSRWLVPALKKRLVFPRTGYVVSRKPSGRLLWLVLSVAAILGGLGGFVAAFISHVNPAARAWIPVILGIEVGGWLLFMGFRFEMKRYLLLAGFSLLAGIAGSLTGTGADRGSAVYMAAMGLALAVSGALALRANLRQAPGPEEQ
ncbi:MAG: hypothetical protein ABSA67_19265 [Candidatus Brocadiia bacterium]|jgi:hypothetical protein